MRKITKFIDGIGCPVTEKDVKKENLMWLHKNKALTNFKPVGSSWYVAIKFQDTIYTEEAESDFDTALSLLIKKIEKEMTDSPVIH